MCVPLASRFVRCGLITLLFVLFASTALAERRSVDVAREAYVAGLDAAKSERWSDAVEHFRRSYELSHSTAALFNLGVALRALGRHREARDAFTMLLDKQELDEPTRLNAEKLRADAGQRVVEVRLEGFEADGAYEVVVDGVPNAVSGTTAFVLEVDEGRHALSVQRGSRTLLRWTGAVQAGAPVSLEIDQAPEQPVAPPVVEQPTVEQPMREPEREPARPPRSHKAWWWAGGGALAVAAAVATVFVFVKQPAEGRTVEPPAGTTVMDL